MAVALLLTFVFGALFATFMMRLFGRPEPRQVTLVPLTVRKSENE